MNCDPLAKWYRWVEYCAFGRALERSRFHFLHHLAGAARVLVLGEGDGRALAQAVAHAPHAEFDVYETSAAMIALAKRRLPATARVRFHHADVRTVDFPHSHYDAAVSLFFLDCFHEDEARQLIGKLTEALTPRALWLVTDFAIPERGWRNWHARLWVWIMYRFFRIATGLRVHRLAPIPLLLSENGLQPSQVVVWRAGLIHSGVWTTLTEPEQL